MFRVEMKKVTHSWLFWITLLIGVGIALVSSFESISSYMFWQEAERDFVQSAAIVRNPEAPISTLFNSWMGQEFSSLTSSLYYLLLPLLAVFPYAWSTLIERKNGYIKNILTRSLRQHYYLAKCSATFLSGAAVVVIPLILNVMLVSAFIPAIRPDVYYDIYYGILPGNALSQLFYAQPIWYIVVRILTAGWFAGLIAMSVIGLSFFIKKYIAILLLPFLALLGIHYAAGLLSEETLIDYSLISSVHGGGLNTNWWVLGVYSIFLLIIGLVIPMYRGARDDVF